MGVWLGPIGGVKRKLPKFSYTGTEPLLLNDRYGNWEIICLNNCAITFSKLLTTVDIFAVGGGNYGGSASGTTGYAKGGDGGTGGQCSTSEKTLITNLEYNIEIGVGGVHYGVTTISPTATKIISSTQETIIEAKPSLGATGGDGAEYSNANNGDPGVFAFNVGNTLYENYLNKSIQFGAGGGGGAARAATYGNSYSAGSGGLTGGGRGGENNNENPTQTSEINGTINTGGGGGGAACINGGSYYGSPGSGGSGIIIIRNHRST